jgi:predicted amidohydrolase YtcJ
MHFMSWMDTLELMDLKPCRSIEDLKGVLKTHMDEHPLPEGEWYRGRGWNHSFMGRMPNRHDLDELSPQNPLALTRVCGHVVVVNSAALKLLGITSDTRIEGGVIELEEDGIPSGVLCEAAVRFVYNRIPRLQDSDMLRLLEKYGPQVASYGLTTLNSDDMSMFRFDFRRAIDFYTAAEKAEKLPFRLRQQFSLPKRDLLIDFLSEGWRTGDGTPLYQIGPLKLLCDGSLGGRTALLRRDYADKPGERGVAMHKQEDLNELIYLAHSSGMQVAAHAIGDMALDMCLDAFEAAQTAAPGIARHQIVHAQIADDGQLDRMKKLGVGAAIQPCFVPSDHNMACERLGSEWANRSYRWKTMLRKGIALSAGSDAPVEDPRPLYGIHAAVTRQSQSGEPKGGWVSEERLSVAEALSLYTWSNAWHGGNEKRRGEIVPGRDADLVVLDRDPFLTPASDLWKIGVAMTVCGGRITYRSDDIAH